MVWRQLAGKYELLSSRQPHLGGEVEREEPAVGGNNLLYPADASFLACRRSEQYPSPWGSRGDFALVACDVPITSSPAASLGATSASLPGSL